ncbi:hypothetical protein RhiLY_14478 [Ceratobasidium sp. AG-Ba]|nr:hypothetical protein RhiLY_14478 [Ceratobasidium sp. AG-Ba]
MTRGRPTTRSSSPFPFTGSLLPALHPPRLAKRHRPPSPFKADTSALIPPPETPMQAIRNRRRRSSISLPDVENGETRVPIRSKRKPMPGTLPLSPRSMNTELRERGSVESGAWKNAKGAYSSINTIFVSKHTLGLGANSIQPPSIDHIFSSPRSPTLELSFDELPAYPNQHQESESDYTSGLFYTDSYTPDSHFDDLVTQLEEMTVRAARSRAQQRERAARRWEALCNARIRFLKEQAAHAAKIRPTTPFGSSGPSSPFESHGAPLTRMSSLSPYTLCGDTLDLAVVSSTSGRDELEALCDPTSSDSARPLIDRMIRRLDEFDDDDISVDGLTEHECRQLRTETRKRRRMDRQRAFELGVLLELKRRQIGRSRSSSDSSVASTSSDSDCDQPASPPVECCPVSTIDHLVAKMVMKRKETCQRTFTSSIAARQVFEARGCSPLRVTVHASVEVRPKFARKRSHSTKATFSDIFTLSGNAFGLGSTAWLKEKRRLTSLDHD